MGCYKLILSTLSIFFLISCGGGGSSSPNPDPVNPNQNPTHPILGDVLGFDLD